MYERLSVEKLGEECANWLNYGNTNQKFESKL